MHYEEKGISCNQIMTYIMAVAIVFSHSIYTYTNNNLFNYGLKVILSVVPLIYILIFCPCIRFDRNKTRRLTFFFLTYYMVLILFAVADVSLSTMSSFLFRFVFFIPLMVIYFSCVPDKRRIFHAFTNVMFVIACVAIFFWLFGTIIGIIHPTGEMYSTWGRTERAHYYFIYFEIPVTALHLPFYRNTGIFGEAPAFCGFLCAALMSEVYLGKNNLIKKIILGMAILSTVSTTGFLIIAYLIVVDIWRYLDGHDEYKTVKWLLIGIPFVLCMLIVLRVMFDTSKLASVYIRLSDYINGIKAWLGAPLWGWGYQIDTSQFNAGFSNSFSLILVNGGIILSLIYYVPMLKILKVGWCKDRRLMYWLVGFVMLFFVLVIGYTYYVLTVLAYGYALFIDDNDVLCHDLGENDGIKNIGYYT